MTAVVVQNGIIAGVHGKAAAHGVRCSTGDVGHLVAAPAPPPSASAPPPSRWSRAPSRVRTPTGSLAFEHRVVKNTSTPGNQTKETVGPLPLPASSPRGLRLLAVAGARHRTPVVARRAAAGISSSRVPLPMLAEGKISECGLLSPPSRFPHLDLAPCRRRSPVAELPSPAADPAAWWPDLASHGPDLRRRGGLPNGWLRCRRPVGDVAVSSSSVESTAGISGASAGAEVSGRVSYNGHDMDEFVPQRTSAYIGQHDLHIGEMTVRETLAFSARCQGVGTRYDMLTELSRREKEAGIKPDPDIDVYMKAISVEGQETVVTDYILKILGLEICADTMVGDAMIRGISGGQKKRVTTGEMLVGPAKALFMDEISTGLVAGDFGLVPGVAKHGRRCMGLCGGVRGCGAAINAGLCE